MEYCIGSASDVVEGKDEVDTQYCASTTKCIHNVLLPTCRHCKLLLNYL